MFIDISASHTKTYKLIGTRSSLHPDASLHFVPTRHDLNQRFAFCILMCALGALITGFAFYVKSLPSTPDRQSYIILQAFQALGFVLLLMGVLHPLGWFRKRVVLSSDQQDNLLIESRVWRTRQQICPKNQIESITFAAIPEQVQRIPVRIDTSDPRAAIARFWVWYVTIRFLPSETSPSNEAIRFQIIATSDAPSERELPDEVVALSQWLREATGKTVHPDSYDF